MVRDALATVIEPELHQDLISLGFVEDVRIEGTDVSFTLLLTTPACPLKDKMRMDCERALHEHIPDVGDISIRFDSRVRSDQRIMDKLNLAVKNIVAVSSGKGGVGKSTVSINLAVSLAREGAKVGLLDADIYGPNIPILIGLNELPGSGGDKLDPAEAHGVSVMSMGFLIPDNQALVWRGPMLHNTIKQLFTEVNWGELDYLIVDLPPGTGDAQLSLAQLVPLTGGLIVTTPQAVAVADAARGVNAFEHLKVPVLGIIENMSGSIFGSGGGERAAERLGVDFLGRVGLDAQIAAGGDEGVPIVVAEPEGESARSFRELARVVAGKISVLGFQNAEGGTAEGAARRAEG
jgi:ATP-binding protein involved in chromosome partitioning